jgi:TolB-like protein
MTFAFGEHELDPRRQELRRAGKVVHVEPQVFNLLLLLVGNRDRIVSKDEILDEIWQGRIVSEAALSSRINAARKAIGDTGSGQSLIRTFHKRGFRFVAKVVEQLDAGLRPAAEAASPTGEVSAGEPFEGGVGDGRPRIAVLPFLNVGGDAQNEYFTYGLTEDVVRLLGRNRWLAVLSRHSGRDLAAVDMDVREVGRALDVRYLVQGSVRARGQHFRITVELVGTDSGRQLWSDVYDFDLANIFDVQDTMAKQIAATIEPEVGTAERLAAFRKPPESLAAWDCYQRGLWHLWGFTTPGFEAAEALFERALELEPGLARALAALSYVSLQKAFYSEPEARLDLLRRALNDARTCVSLDERDCLCHCVLGRALTLQRQYDEGIAALEHALELNPSFAQGYFALAFAMVWAGRHDEALALIERATELSPRDPHLWTFHQVKGLAYFSLHDLDGAALFARKAIRQPNATYFPHALLTTSLGLMHDVEAARAAGSDLLSKRPGYSLAYAEADLFYCSDMEFVGRYLGGLRRAGIPG